LYSRLKLLRRYGPIAMVAATVFGGGILLGAPAARSASVHDMGSSGYFGVRHAMQSSTNWAGYVVAGQDPATTPAPTTPEPALSFTNVSGRWVQPALACVRSKPTFAAFWVGIGGSTPASQALEQVGTQATCTSAGKATYSMWYEVVPAPSVGIKFKVFPGNSISASVQVTGTRVTLRIRNLTRRTLFTKTLSVAEPDLSSAEWIAEAPSGCNAAGCRQLPLAQFRPVTFTSATATTSDGHVGTISDPAWSPTMFDLLDTTSVFAGGTTVTGALPSQLSPNGASFEIAWQPAITIGRALSR
jgi:hypothetical protein